MAEQRNFSGLPKATYPDWKPLRRKDHVLVVGTGRHVWADIERLGIRKLEGFDILCIKDSLMHWRGNVDHAVSEHPEQLVWFSKLRRARRRLTQETKLRLHTSAESYESVHNWRIPRYGCSGMAACVIALLLGYERVILAGIHLDDSGHYYDPTWVKTNFDQQYKNLPTGDIRIWNKMRDGMFQGKVKAISGRLAGYLGEP